MLHIEAKKQLRAGELKQAYDSALEALSQDREDGEAWGIMSLVALEGGNILKSLELSQKAVVFGARSAMLLGGRGRALLATGQQDEARELASGISPHECETAVEADTIGVILARTGLHARALPFFNKATEERPDHPQFLYNQATSLQFIGKLKQAREGYERLLAIAPDFHRARLALVQLQKAEEHDLATIETLFERHGHDADAALQLGHAAARVLEARGNHSDSLDWLLKAKQLKAQSTAHDRQWAKRLFAAARKNDAAVAQDVETQPGSAPALIIGMPRSGTTLVERILSSHSAVTSAGELPDLALLAKRSTQIAGAHTLSAEVLAAEFDPVWVGDKYRSRTARLAGSSQRLIDKMPFNFFFARHALASMPDARIVMVRRDPRDTVFANFRQLFATDFGYYDYAYRLADTAHFVAQFVELADHWRSTLPTSRYTEVHYESLISDQESESRRLIDFLGLSWEEACLSFHRNAAPVATASSVQVRAPIHSKSVGQWRRYGAAGEDVDRTLRELGVALPD